MRRIIFTAIVCALAACGAETASKNGEAEAQPAAAAAAESAAQAEPARDLLTLAEGAVLVSASRDPARALSLTDGDPETTWTSGGPRYPGPYVFVFELRAPTRLERVGVIGAGVRPGGVAGASANLIKIEASAQSATEGFAEIGSYTAAETGESSVSAALDHDVRWLRYTIQSNHGAADWTYLGEAVAYGAQTPPALNGSFNGVFAAGARDLIELKQDGGSLSGCFVEQAGNAHGAIVGDVVDGVARVSWRRTDGPDVSGIALLVIDSRGHLNGVRYRDRSRSVWGGAPAAEGATTPCSAAAPANPIAQALEDEGEARLYGILFDFDQATIKATSEPALRQLLAALEANAAMNVDVEGHTDNAGEDAYNLALSQRRAQAVVAWLIENGIAAARLNPVGKGETAPVASNDTADGRALNRRVEVRRR